MSTNLAARTPVVRALPTVMVVGAAGAIVFGWMAASSTLAAGGAVTNVILTPCLILAYVLARRFPIHMDGRAGTSMGTVPLYLMAAMLPPPLAGTAAFLAVLSAELLARGECDQLGSDIAINTSRYALVVFAGSIVAHFAVAGDLHAVQWVVAAGVMWLADFATLPLLFTPATGQPPLRIIRALIREAGAMEGAQYLIGMLGYLAAQAEIWGLGLLLLPTILVYRAFRSTKEMRAGTRHILDQSADMVDARDVYTGGHSYRVRSTVEEILKAMNVKGIEMEIIASAARLHDIGKIGVPDDILNKPSSLTVTERERMQSHVVRGADLLAGYRDFAQAAVIVRHHHEFWDGSGYPDGLKGEEIPLGSRVIAVADSYDAMTSTRPYRPALTQSQAAAALEAGRGTQWDPAVIDAFLIHVLPHLEETEPRLQLVRPSNEAGETA